MKMKTHQQAHSPDGKMDYRLKYFLTRLMADNAFSKEKKFREKIFADNFSLQTMTYA